MKSVYVSGVSYGKNKQTNQPAQLFLKPRQGY